MAVHNHNIIDIDLGTGSVARSFMNRTLGEGDIEFNRFGVRCFRDGQKVSLAGCAVVGSFLRPDGTTVLIGEEYGEVGDNEAAIVLPGACYAYEGQFALTIQITTATGGKANPDHGVTGTVRIIDGTIVKTDKGTYVDPGNIIVNLADLDDVAAAAVAAATAIAGYNVTAVNVSGDNYQIEVNTP